MSISLVNGSAGLRVRQHCPLSVMRQALELTSDLTFFIAPRRPSAAAPPAFETLRLLDVNRAACAALAYSRRTLLTRELEKIVSPKAHRLFAQRVRKAFRQPDVSVDGPIQLRARDGQTVITQARLRYVNDSRQPLFVLVGRDITNRRHRERLLSSSAHVDPLTGLPNRAVLEGRLQRTLVRAKKRDRRFAVLLIDVDHFKKINDGHGHLAGDAVLKTVARRVADSLRTDDLVVRYGGDEFLVLIDDVGDEGKVHGLADRILSAVGAPIVADGVQLQVSVSVGITIANGFAHSIPSLIGRADQGMYRAKALGRNRRYTIGASDESAPVPV